MPTFLRQAILQSPDVYKIWLNMHNASIQSLKVQHGWLLFSKSEDIFKAVRSQLPGDKDNDKSFSQMRARSSEQLLYMHLMAWLKAFRIPVGNSYDWY